MKTLQKILFTLHRFIYDWVCFRLVSVFGARPVAFVVTLSFPSNSHYIFLNGLAMFNLYTLARAYLFIYSQQNVMIEIIIIHCVV